MDCYTKHIEIPACEPFTAFSTILPNTPLVMSVKYQGERYTQASQTFDTGIFPIDPELLPPGMVNRWDTFTVQFADTNGNEIAVDGEGNSMFVMVPTQTDVMPEC